MRNKYVNLVWNQTYTVVISKPEENNIIYHASTVLKKVHVVG